MIKKRAFTLAEVLITLGVIGIVAALTIPSLIQKQNEKQTVVRLKKAYSSLQQAYQMIMIEDGPITEWGLTKAVGAKEELIILDKFAKYMKFTKNCGNDLGCYPSVVYKGLDGEDYATWEGAEGRSRAVLSDGTLIMFNNTLSSIDIRDAQIYVDTNGFKGPNILGVDFFYLSIIGNKILPLGVEETEFQNSCLKGSGTACAGWVILNDNLDYLHCKDLSLNGKSKC